MQDRAGELDARVAWIETRVRGALRTATGRSAFARDFFGEDSSRAIREFLDYDNRSALYFAADRALALTALPRSMPANTTVLYFLKLRPAPVPIERVGHEVLVGELTPEPLVALERVMHLVYCPLLTNPENQERWGEVATREIVEKLHGFRATVTICFGQTQGETFLPLPPTDPSGVVETGKERMHLLESAIITWQKQIRNVLRLDPESLMKQGYHPTPDMELQFWRTKAANLNAIQAQLESEPVRLVLRFMDQSKHTYCAPFAKLCKEVMGARDEANDNAKYLTVLEPWIRRMQTMGDFEQLPELFKPVLHLILLVWRHSKHYNTPSRLVVMVRELCNLLISRAMHYVSGEDVFRMLDAEEALQAARMLRATLAVCGTFKTAYFHYKAEAKALCPDNEWRVQNNALFLRLDSFLERCHDILDLTQTVVQFNKLATIEVGGTKGKALTISVQQTYSDFQQALTAFKAVRYDVMDVNAKQFDDDFYDFRCRIKELERRLGSLLTQGFDDASTIQARFKLLDSFDTLLDRPIIQDEMEKKHLSLVHAYGAELKEVQDMFLLCKAAPPVAANLPPIAGALVWCRGLLERIHQPMDKLHQLNKTIMEREETKEVLRLFESLSRELQDFQDMCIQEWGRDVEASSQAKLKLPLLKRDEQSGMLSVNFDPELVRLLREMKYFLLLDLDVPATALNVYRKREVYRRQTGNLDLVVNLYNAMVASLLPVERPLVQQHFDKIDATLRRGLEVMNWKSHGIDDYITDSMAVVRAANDILSALKQHLAQIEDTLRRWCRPQFTRSSKPVPVAEFETAMRAARAQYCDEVKRDARVMHELLKQSSKVLRVSHGQPDWKAYVDFVNGIVEDGVVQAVLASLQYLLEQVDNELITKHDKLPLLEIELRLSGKAVMFVPRVAQQGSGQGVLELVQAWVQEFLQVASLLRRVDTGTGDYSQEVKESPEVQEAIQRILQAVTDNGHRCFQVRGGFIQYRYLWEVDVEQEFAAFLRERGWMVPGDAHRAADAEAGSLSATPGATWTRALNLAAFDEVISRFRAVQDEIATLSTPCDVGWLRVNAQPIKQALSTWTTKWVYHYTQYLHDYVAHGLGAMVQFMDRVSEGLEEDVAAGDMEALMRVMTRIRDVRRRAQQDSSELFQPFRNAVALLKAHGMPVDEVMVGGAPVLDQLAAAPMRWKETVNKMYKKKENILHLQQSEADKTRAAAGDFRDTLQEFRAYVRREAPFAFEGAVNDAYCKLDDCHMRLRATEVEAERLAHMEELFELPVTMYQELLEARQELRLVKQLWDFKAMVGHIFAHWEATPWTSIRAESSDPPKPDGLSIEAMMDTSRRLDIELRRATAGCPGACSWQVCKDVAATLRNMLTVLPLLEQLRDKAVRERHWKALSMTCHVKPIDARNPRLCLQDLLRLNLHQHVDAVRDIVECAVKESKIEDKLEKIDQTWARMQLEYAQHRGSGTHIVCAPDEVVEHLEAHQLELQGMVGMGRYAEFFFTRIERWQRDLAHVEAVLRMWLSVTKQWESLESIFLNSPDIRTQLPDDTRRFEMLDAEFRALMAAAVGSSNVLEACTTEGRDELLRSSLLPSLELCQRSLNEYLDVKKKVFARFYFLSNAALLDILSNGANPKHVMKHLGDCYDGLSTLIFRAGTADCALHMRAKDGEEVELHAPLVMHGAVERWLNELTGAMQLTLRHGLEGAMEAAVHWDTDNPREQWVFQHAGQLAVTASQVLWTEETEAALEDLEAGNEDAVKKYAEVCAARLEALIRLVQGDLSRADRTKTISVITMDVHNRDVVQRLVSGRAEGPQAFLWQQQLRSYKAEGQRDVEIRIVDFRQQYAFEYIGNTGRLVITPLTDRCYITLAVALRLMLGGAPAGPAGTGKTETTKDFARALALPCYVFNCSDQMNYQTMADIFKGLAQTGAWGCFDEFNRIPVEVLSVVATQVKSVLDAIACFAAPANREPEFQHLPPGQPPVKVGHFQLLGDTVALIPSTGFFITMNPGYAGRAELPENLKALFRPCAMIQPDLEPICENMLMAEGFVHARPLAVKFVSLYRLSAELLTPQPHYDWGLRAVKAVLRVAGSLRRAEPGMGEEAVLLRALRDFNTPKMPLADVPVFLRILQDLFPTTHATASRINPELRAQAKTACLERGLQPEDGLLSKVLQFHDLLDVRHSVVLLGPAGCGKTTIWQTLKACRNMAQPKHVAVSRIVNPKAVTSDELYGCMTLSREWRDGALSFIMRGMSRNTKEQGFYEHQTSKWVVLDGDIDAEWIESMNTVMDDNKVLTLVSNERIPLSESMRLVLEVNSLKNATPATVSRAGILFVNESDIGWQPFADSWIARQPNDVLRMRLATLFKQHVEPLLDGMRRGFAHVVPVRAAHQVSTLCHLLEGLLAAAPGAQHSTDLLDSLFTFACVWAFGGTAAVDKGGDSRKRFHSLWCTLFGAPKIQGDDGSTQVFDCFVDMTTGELLQWRAALRDGAGSGSGRSLCALVPGGVAGSATGAGGGPPMGAGAGMENSEGQCASMIVPTVDSVRTHFLLDLLLKRGRPVMLVGPAGSGKTVTVHEYLQAMDESMLHANVGMHYFMDSASLQRQLESSLDKRSGTTYGPPPNKKLLFFVDDLNLPYVEAYGTQNALELLRQVVDSHFVYDRTDLSVRKELCDVGFVAAMNPTAGSFAVSERLQRHFATFASPMPEADVLASIYTAVLQAHLVTFDPSVSAMVPSLVQATIRVHKAVATRFLPSASRFTYNWTMRELSDVTQGLCQAKREYFAQPLRMARLWLHECHRVFGDRLVTDIDTERFSDILHETAKREFAELDQAELHQEPLLFSSFVSTAASGEPAYLPVPASEEGRAQLRAAVEAKLAVYNESSSIMELVLFDQAVEHVARICRILLSPRGNALLVGVGGSGKQSLARLASFICGFEVHQLAVSSRFTLDDFQESLKDMCRIAGVRNVPLTLVFSDAHVVEERFLVIMHQLLSSGWVPDLYTREELDGVHAALRAEAKANGVQDHPASLQAFFLARLRANMHVILAFSPAGDTLRVRARRFPALVSCVAIDVLHPWPREALVSVALRFLQSAHMGATEVRENVAHHMAEVHLAVEHASERFLALERRHNYVTPTSFLGFIAAYTSLLRSKHEQVEMQLRRLEVGLATLRRTAEDVSGLQLDLKARMLKVEEKRDASNQLLEQMGKQRGEAEQQHELARVEQGKAEEAQRRASEIEREAEAELAEARPKLEAARAAVDCLNKASLTELKNFTKPPAGVEVVTKACLMMLEGEFKNHKWERAKKLMARTDALLQQLRDYDATGMSDQLVARLEPVVTDPVMEPTSMRRKSEAAANLCIWVQNIYEYNRVYVKVHPLMMALAEARENKSRAEAEFGKVQAVVDDVERRLRVLQATFLEATNEKARVEAEAAACQERLALAERLVHGLSSERARWEGELEVLATQRHSLVGDAVLSAAFASYLGAFNAQFRHELWHDAWLPDLLQREIPLTEGATPLALLADDAATAKMMGEGLPADPTSIENGAIIANAQRWPLMVDPQLQGIRWLRQREAERGVVVVQQTQAGWLAALQQALTAGTTLVIENLGESVDATLEPVLSRAVFKRGRNLYVRLAGEDVEFDPGFRLYLQTKLANPHYYPELQAKCTLVNFIATQRGLEDQLLAKVVNVERPELERQQQELQKLLNEYKIQLLDLEDQLLERLSNAPEDILSDVPLVEGLESLKRTSQEVGAAVEKGRQTAEEVRQSREVYRVVAEEGAALYFILTGLCNIDHMYQFSLDAFEGFFFKAIRGAPRVADPEAHAANLRQTLRLTIYTWASRGLFERHRLILLAQITFSLMRRSLLTETLEQEELNFLLRGPSAGGSAADEAPDDDALSWVPRTVWQAVLHLSSLSGFEQLPSDMMAAASRFREWFRHVAPEGEKLPLEWATLDKDPFRKLLVVRALRPDRMTVALQQCIRRVLPDGAAFVDCDAALHSTQVLAGSMGDATATTPLLFILSPGADAVADVDKVAAAQGRDKGTDYHNVSMGQGQDSVAMALLEQAHRQGEWLMLNNVHLMPRWLALLENKLDEFAQEGSHPDFRLFLSSDPSRDIPVGLLARSIKLNNEPPSGLKASVKRAFCSLPREQFDEAEPRAKAILFGLSYFHAIMVERKRFGAAGFNAPYPFSLGDLRDSAACLAHALENATSRVPWDDLRFLVGDVLYGGHVTHHWDRLLCSAYLEHFLRDGLLEEMEMVPFVGEERGASFRAPAPSSYSHCLAHVEEQLTQDNPLAYGLHPNAELHYRTSQSVSLFSALLELQPRAVHEGGAAPQLHLAENVLNDILERFNDAKIDMDELAGMLMDRGPFQIVLQQEAELLNALLAHMQRELVELNQGFAGELTLSDHMEQLTECLFLDRVPASWARLAWPSMRPLQSWLVDLQARLEQVKTWAENPLEVPRVMWLPGLLNPQAFLTAILQQTAQRTGTELDRLTIVTEVTRKATAEDVDAPPREGAYVHGLTLEGAGWDAANGVLTWAKPREMYTKLPVLHFRAVPVPKPQGEGVYVCPLYKTTQRGASFVCSCQLRTRSPPARWVLAGVALIMDVGEP